MHVLVVTTLTDNVIITFIVVTTSTWQVWQLTLYYDHQCHAVSVKCTHGLLYEVILQYVVSCYITLPLVYIDDPQVSINVHFAPSRTYV